MKMPGGTGARHRPRCKYPTLFLLRRTIRRSQVGVQASENRLPLSCFVLAIDVKTGKPDRTGASASPAPFRRMADENPRASTADSGAQMNVGIADANVVVEQR